MTTPRYLPPDTGYRPSRRPMGVVKKPAMFVPERFRAEVFKVSKATLADVAWNLAGGCVNSAEDEEQVIRRLREEIEITTRYRKGTP